MKDVLFWLSLAAVAYLAYDDYSKRDVLKQAQSRLGQTAAYQSRLIAERDQAVFQRDQALQNPPRVYMNPAPSPAPPEWFQQHLNQGSSLDASRRHDRP